MCLIRLRYWYSSCEGSEGVDVVEGLEVPLVAVVAFVPFVCEEFSEDDITGSRAGVAIMYADL
jgi:hypothetical protein